MIVTFSKMIHWTYQIGSIKWSRSPEISFSSYHFRRFQQAFTLPKTVIFRTTKKHSRFPYVRKVCFRQNCRFGVCENQLTILAIIATELQFFTCTPLQRLRIFDAPTTGTCDGKFWNADHFRHYAQNFSSRLITAMVSKDFTHPLQMRRYKMDSSCQTA